MLQSSDQDANCPRCRAPSIDLTTPAPPNLVQLSAGDMEGERAGTGGEAEPTV